MTGSTCTVPVGGVDLDAILTALREGARSKLLEVRDEDTDVDIILAVRGEEPALSGRSMCR